MYSIIPPNSEVLHWSKIQTPNYAIKPTLEMTHLEGKVIPLKTFIKGESRKFDDPPIRMFLFDEEYVRVYFFKNIFNPRSVERRKKSNKIEYYR